MINASKMAFKNDGSSTKNGKVKKMNTSKVDVKSNSSSNIDDNLKTNDNNIDKDNFDKSNKINCKDSNKNEESSNLDEEFAKMEEILSKVDEDSLNKTPLKINHENSSQIDEKSNDSLKKSNMNTKIDEKSNDSFKNVDEEMSQVDDKSNSLKGYVENVVNDKSNMESNFDENSNKDNISTENNESMDTQSAESSKQEISQDNSYKPSVPLEKKPELESEESLSSEKLGEALFKSRKRPIDCDNESDSTCSGMKKVRVEKKHCSDGEQDQENLNKSPSSSAKKERRRSCSETELIKDLDSFKSVKHLYSEFLKKDGWKQPELTPEEQKRLEQTSAREKKMRENCLRLIQRDYKDITVDDLEDSMYVAMMDYFCHYNPSGLLKRKVAMLLKLLSVVQENYNRTFKQFCEAKYLLKRIVEIRKEEQNNCTCKDKLPFKMIRSVAVQVQTSRCRGGDLCPGSGVGLDPKFKPDLKLNASRKRDVSPGGSAKKSDQSTSSSDSEYKESDKSNENRPKHINISLPPTQQSSSPTLRPRSDFTTKPLSELLNGKQPQSQSNGTVQSGRSSLPNSARQPNFVTSTQDVIDLTDKDEDPGPSSTVSNSTSSKPSQVTIQQPVTRVVKTSSILSPIPSLPPLPPAPYYKPSIKRPPQPMLKVCKADQSGIMLSWTLKSATVNEIMFYQVFACQENCGVTKEWNTVGDVKALPLPMACTLSQFREGHRYHFVVRAVDKFKILGEFSHPASILLVSKNGSASNSAITAPPARR